MNVRPAIRNLAIVFAVILIPVAAHQLWDYIELRRLIAEIEAIRARGEPVTELEAGGGRAPEPGEPQRAGRMYMAAALLSANAGYAVFPIVSGVHEWLSGAVTVPPATAAEQLQSLISEASQALALADQAGSLSFQGFPPGTAYSYRTSELHLLSRLVAARTIGLSLQGQGDAAIESAVSAQRLRLALRELGWPSGFGDVREVPAILSLSQPTAAALQRLQDSLQAEDPDRAVDAVLLERARRIESVWRRNYGSLPQAPDRYLLPVRSVTETVMRPWLSGQTVRTLRIWADVVAVARTPWPGRVDEAAAMVAKYRGDQGEMTPPSGPLAAIRRAAFYQRQSVDGMFARIARPDDLVNLRASIAAIAVERHRRDHNGALPAALQDLVPQYLAVVPADPVTGGPLLFKRDAAAYTIYSVGPDKKDDGGDLNSLLLKAIKQGFGGRVVRGADLGVRVVMRPRS